MNITVYCGASSGNKTIYAEKTRDLGQWFLDKGHQLVFGGGKIGLMGILANTLIEGGGVTIGVMPGFLIDREIGHPGLSQFIRVETMVERKEKMMQLGHAFIALPGGPGTLEEISEVISWSRIGQNNKPCLLYNMEGYFDSLKHQFDKMVEEGFLSKDDRDLVLFAETIEEMESFILSYQAPDFTLYQDIK